MKKFDFNDILLVPEINTTINSRYKDIKLPSHYLPLFTAPMDTVVDLTNMDEFIKAGINVVLPRTVKYKDFKQYYNSSPLKYKNVFVSFGLDEIKEMLHHLNIDMSDSKNMSNYDIKIYDLHDSAKILIDVANGHMKSIVDLCKKIKEVRPDIKIMVGNIANPETYAWYATENCVDYIRVGIGAGGGCLTTKNSGVGYPMASLISEMNDMRNILKQNGVMDLPAIIADGGMKEYADIIKAINLGADGVMSGTIFNKSFESCGSNYIYGIKINKRLAKFLFKRKFPVKKHYRGMSTKNAQKAMGKTNLKTSEGVIRYWKIEYFINGWIENFIHYLRSAMSYSNCTTLDEFKGKSNYIEITTNVYNRFNK